MKRHTPPPEYDKKENAKRLREGLEGHIRLVASKALHKYGCPSSMDGFNLLLADNEIVRFPTSLHICRDGLMAGEAVRLQKADEDEKYDIIIDDRFSGRDEDIISLAISQIVKVNYGKIAKEKEAALFGSVLLGVAEEEYEARLARLKEEIS